LASIKDQRCPSCSQTLNAAKALDGQSLTPEPGDLSICMHCHKGLTWDENMDLRLATSTELDELWQELCKLEEEKGNAKVS
jgi:hypothetical protein